MKREEAGGETAAISSVPAPHLPATPLPAPPTQLNPDLLLCPGAKIPFFLGLQAGLWEGTVSHAGTMQGICLLQLKWQFLRGKKESESEVLLHIQSPHLLIK